MVLYPYSLSPRILDYNPPKTDQVRYGPVFTGWQPALNSLQSVDGALGSHSMVPEEIFLEAHFLGTLSQVES